MSSREDALKESLCLFIHVASGEFHTFDNIINMNENRIHTFKTYTQADEYVFI